MPHRAPVHRPPNVVAGLAATRRAYDKARGSAADRGYDARWRAYAKAFLARHPWCQCERCAISSDPLPARHVDHIVAVTGPDDPLFWRESNHRAMSHACHSRKTVREDGALHRSSGAPQQRAASNGAATSMAII
jgi:5-methylcytosine-specific restriction endonuclease McrA